MKKIISIMLSLVMVFAMVSTAFASDSYDKSSVILSKDLFSRNKSGKGTYRNERVFDWSNNDVDTVVKYIFKFKDITNKTQDLSVQIRVSENGNLI